MILNNLQGKVFCGDKEVSQIYCGSTRIWIPAPEPEPEQPTQGGGNQGNRGSGTSDIRLKRNIEYIGLSPSGLKIYEFDYIDKLGRYQGVMAQDLLEINNNHPAITVDSNGYYMVDYDYIDVEFKMVENVLL